jgi:hypothetical protein
MDDTAVEPDGGGLENVLESAKNVRLLCGSDDLHSIADNHLETIDDLDLDL